MGVRWADFQLGRLFPAGHDDLAGANRFDDVELREHRDRRIDFQAVAKKHDDHRRGREIDGFSGKMFGDLQRLRALGG